MKSVEKAYKISLRYGERLREPVPEFFQIFMKLFFNFFSVIPFALLDSLIAFKLSHLLNVLRKPEQNLNCGLSDDMRCALIFFGFL